MMSKPIIAVFCDYYLPGYKAGGSLRSIANMVAQLATEYEFRIVTRDRDLGDQQPYAHLDARKWYSVGDAQVCYLSPDRRMYATLIALIKDMDPAILYFGSFFSPYFTILPLMLRRLKLIPPIPVVLASEGELNDGSIQYKRTRKQLFIQQARYFGLYDHIFWRVSSELEADVIQRRMRKEICAFVAPNLPTLPERRDAIHLNMDVALEPKQAGYLKLIYLSRIAPVKNLLAVCNMLQNVQSNILLSIYGPIEDDLYWQDCQSVLDSLPENIRYVQHGAVLNENVTATISTGELFILPTLGESFGYVIVEAWMAGCPVLISDQTPWCDLDALGVGWDIPLDQPMRFAEVIEHVAAMSEAEHAQLRNSVRQFACNYLYDAERTACYRRLFDAALMQCV